jgi:hypothetical protein
VDLQTCVPKSATPEQLGAAARMALEQSIPWAPEAH